MLCDVFKNNTGDIQLHTGTCIDILFSFLSFFRMKDTDRRSGFNITGIKLIGFETTCLTLFIYLLILFFTRNHVSPALPHASPQYLRDGVFSVSRKCAPNCSRAHGTESSGS